MATWHGRPFAALLVLVASFIPIVLVAAGPASGATTLPTGFTDTVVASGFGDRLTTLTFAPDGRLFVSEKTGALRVVKNGQLLSAPFATLGVDSYLERGLLGVAFDPDFATNRFVYVFYTSSATLKNRISRLTASSTNPDVAVAGSEVVILDDIPSDSGYHNGGALHFGADGKLYASVGDNANAPYAQNLNVLAGKMLRINPDGTVPSDNPYAGVTGKRGEIWAAGLRNPYTFAFDPGSSLMYINDVGNNTWEEIDQGARGANYGWPTCEGACSNPAFVNPIYAYSHDGTSASITGAAFYRGTTFPSSYTGDFFFGDYARGWIKYYNPATQQVSDFAGGTQYVADLRVGPSGDLFYLNVEAKQIHRISYSSSTPTPTPTPSPTPGSGTVTLTPIADDHVSSANPTANYATSAKLYTSAGTSTNRAYLKFDLTSVAGKNITSATFTFTTVNDTYAGSTSGQRMWLVPDTSWTETGLTFQTAPAMTVILGEIGTLAANTTSSVAFDPIPIQQRAGGRLAFAVDGDGTDVMYFNSREAASGVRPRLVLDYTTPLSPTGDAPVATIDAPTDGTSYNAGTDIAYSGSATDTEDRTLGASAFTWEVLFHHETHTHPVLEPTSGMTSGTLHIADTGEASPYTWYRIHLTVHDSAGNVTDVYRDIVPNTASFTLTMNPAAQGLTLDGSPVTTPATVLGVVGFKRELAAPSSVAISGTAYAFDSWSDGGAQSHTILSPASPTTFTARYTAATSTTIASDTFTRTRSSGWGSADQGGAWTVSAGAAFATTGSAGSITISGAGTTRTATLTAATARDVDVTARVARDRTTTGNGQFFYLVGRRVDASNEYRGSVRFAADGSVYVRASRFAGGSEAGLGPSEVKVAGLAAAPGTVIHVRLRITGTNPTTVNLRAWADGAAEPTTWQVTQTDSTAALQASGAVGVRAFIAANATNAPVVMSVDDFVAIATT